MNLFVAGDDFFLVDMLLIVKDGPTVYDNVSNGRTIQREDDDRQQIFG
jgi:hypothetical protein